MLDSTKLNAWIAEYPLGWRAGLNPETGQHWRKPDGSWTDVRPDMHRDLAIAWRVVEWISGSAGMSTPSGLGFPAVSYFGAWWGRANLWAESAPDAAERICRAAYGIVHGQIDLLREGQA